MKRNTLMKCLLLIATEYDKFKVHNNAASIEFWYETFKDEDDDLFKEAVKRVVTSCEFVPKIANINKMLAELKNSKQITSADIFDEITKAIRYYGSYRSEEAYNSLSEVTKATVNGLGGFKTLCHSETFMIDRAHALKIADSYLERDRKELLITNSMKKEQLENKNRMLELTNNIVKGF